MNELYKTCHPERSEGPLQPLSAFKSFFTAASKLLTACKLLTAALREIFDESAYERFLVHHDLRPSAAAYAAFWSEHESTKVRPRCC